MRFLGRQLGVWDFGGLREGTRKNKNEKRQNGRRRKINTINGCRMIFMEINIWNQCVFIISAILVVI